MVNFPNFQTRDEEEHRSVNGVEAKAVVPYFFDGTNLVPSAQADLTSRLVDDGTYVYSGDAAPGTATSAASWRIQRLTKADSTLLWADGNANFDNVWDNYASLSYS